MITSKEQLFPLEIGTYGLGATREEIRQDVVTSSTPQTHDVEALRFAFESGMNYIETSYIYAGGQTMRFLADFFKQIPREKIFITVKIEKFVEKPSDIETQFDKYLSMLGIDHADAILLHSPSVSKIPLEEAYGELNKQVAKGKARFLSASNVSIDDLKLLTETCGYKLFGIEELFNLECKINEDVGIIQYCKDHNIAFACYQPLRRNRTANRNYPVLVELSKKYGKTQNQVLLNWIINEKGLMPMVKTSNMIHTKENLEALTFKVEPEDMKRLNEFRSAEFDSIKVDWKDEGGISIYKLANQFP